MFFLAHIDEYLSVLSNGGYIFHRIIIVNLLNIKGTMPKWNRVNNKDEE